MKQAEFLMCPSLEVLFGGAAGGGKTVAMLMAALMYVEVPGYSALLLRKSYNDLAQPKCLIPLSHEWLQGKGAKWRATNFQWLFPSGATISFGYLQNEIDKFRYQGAEFQFIGFDELTQHPDTSYRYLFSRLRKPKTLDLPIRMRSTSNPGGIGHDWVKQRFLTEVGEDRVFIPAGLADNSYLDQEEYVKSLDNLDIITRRQLLDGDWTARESGGKFRREWFPIVDKPPMGGRFVRYWDLAGTKPIRGRDPDYTVGVLMTEKDGVYYVCDVKRIRDTPEGVENLVKRTADEDATAHYNYEIIMEREPGSAGVTVIDHYARNVLKGYSFFENRTTGDKELRANPFSSAAEMGNIRLVRGGWLTAYLDELEAFPNGSHDDQVDASSGAFGRFQRAKGFIIYR